MRISKRLKTTYPKIQSTVLLIWWGQFREQLFVKKKICLSAVSLTLMQQNVSKLEHSLLSVLLTPRDAKNLGDFAREKNLIMKIKS